MLYPFYIPIGERHGIGDSDLKKENIPEIDESHRNLLFCKKKVFLILPFILFFLCLEL